MNSHPSPFSHQVGTYLLCLCAGYLVGRIALPLLIDWLAGGAP